MIEQYSEFKITKGSVKFAGAVASEKFGCLGTADESFNTRPITKKCEGVTVKNKNIPDGTGTLKLSLHMRLASYRSAFGISNEGLKEGVYGYGKFQHKQFTFTCITEDDEGNVKYKAYPNCVVSSGLARKIDNSATEVAEVEIEIALAADENGYPMYEAFEEDLKDADVKAKWLTNFTSELVKGAPDEITE